MPPDVPLIGVCLGSQLIARAAGAWIGPATAPEVGWVRVELNEWGVTDPVLGVLPVTVDAFQWHYYTFGLPEGALELASSAVAKQAYRLGDRVWGIQFHAEVERDMLAAWFRDGREELGIRVDEMWAVTDRHLHTWNAQGRALCDAFLDEAKHLAPREALAIRPSVANRRLRRERRVARPLVPRPGIVPRDVARCGQDLRRERGAAARVAVGDHLGAGGSADELADRVAPVASSSADSSTFRAPGMCPGLGSHGATRSPANSSARRTSSRTRPCSASRSATSLVVASLIGERRDRLDLGTRPTDGLRTVSSQRRIAG